MRNDRPPRDDDDDADGRCAVRRDVDSVNASITRGNNAAVAVVVVLDAMVFVMWKVVFECLPRVVYKYLRQLPF